MITNSKYMILISFIIGVILGHIIYFGVKANIEAMYPNIFLSSQSINFIFQVNTILV